MVPHESVESLRASAEEDLWTANLVKDRDDEKTRIICFHLQQYVEKMLKAKLLEKGIQYPRKTQPICPITLRHSGMREGSLPLKKWKPHSPVLSQWFQT